LRRNILVLQNSMKCSIARVSLC